MGTKYDGYHRIPFHKSDYANKILSSDPNIARKLVHAIEQGDLSAFQNLLKFRVDPNSRLDEFGTRPMHIAAGFSGQMVVWMLEKMLQNGGNPNIRNAELLTPVHVASIENRVNNLRVLMEYGGVPSLRCDQGYTALAYAKKHRSVDCINFLNEVTMRAAEDNSRVAAVADISQYFSCPATPELSRHRSVSVSRHVVENEESRVRKSSLRRSSSGGRAGGSRASSCSRKSSVFSSDSEDDSGFNSAERRRKMMNPVKAAVRWVSDELLSRDASRVQKETQSPSRSRENSRTRWSSGLEKESTNESLQRKQEFDAEFAAYASMTDSELRQQLRHLGVDAGPINSSTNRTIYIRKLIALKRLGPENIPLKEKGFCSELEKVMLGKHDLEEVMEMERRFTLVFEMNNLNEKRCYFTYLLLDPRTTQNLPHQLTESRDMDVAECIKVFLKAVFYIGKGKNSRPMDHLKEAKLAFQSNQDQNSLKPKVKRILEIWEKEYGVISLLCFNGLTENEAYTREHLMMEALGLERLTNARSGTAYQEVTRWTGYQRRLLGSYFLLKAFGILMKEGERQLFPQNL